MTTFVFVKFSDTPFSQPFRFRSEWWHKTAGGGVRLSDFTKRGTYFSKDVIKIEEDALVATKKSYLFLNKDMQRKIINHFSIKESS